MFMNSKKNGLNILYPSDLNVKQWVKCVFCCTWPCVIVIHSQRECDRNVKC